MSNEEAAFFDQIYRNCKSDLDEIETLILDKAESSLIQEKMRDLKARWHQLRKDNQGTELEMVLREAFGPLDRDARTNTKPGQKWLDAIADAEVSFSHMISWYKNLPESKKQK